MLLLAVKTIPFHRFQQHSLKAFHGENLDKPYCGGQLV